jgi:hypothetical protein
MKRNHYANMRKEIPMAANIHCRVFCVSHRVKAAKSTDVLDPAGGGMFLRNVGK